MISKFLKMHDSCTYIDIRQRYDHPYIWKLNFIGTSTYMRSVGFWHYQISQYNYCSKFGLNCKRDLIIPINAHEMLTHKHLKLNKHNLQVYKLVSNFHEGASC
jgi:hypothetical protein